MNILSIEIKAKIENPDAIESLLLKRNADYKGMDHQIDTYFKSLHGRLKLRQGNIENSLISYQRKEVKGIKKSVVKLQKLPNDCQALLEILSDQLEIQAQVDKHRKIFFIENVKFHLDEVKGLGSFMEIEALDTEGNKSEIELQKQCDFYMEIFEIKSDSLIDKSYSDMV